MIAKKSIQISFTTAFAVIAFVYHILLDQHYCLSADDFAGIDHASKGMPGLSYAWRFYMEWEGPFLSHVIQGLIMRAVVIGGPPVLMLFLVKLCVLGSSVILLGSINKRCKIGWTGAQEFQSALAFFVTLYLISPNKQEIWHWLVGTAYLTPIIFLQLGTAAIIERRFFLAVPPLAFVMQSRATYSLLVFAIIVLLGFVSIMRKEKDRSKWMWMTVILFAFLAAYLLAPGNYVRMAEHGKSISFMLSQFKMGLLKLLVSYNLAKMDRVLFGLMAGLPVLVTGRTIPIPHNRWFLLFPLLGYVGFLVAHEMLFVCLTGYQEWTRVLSLHSFLFLVLAWIYCAWASGILPHDIKGVGWPLSIFGTMGMIWFLYGNFGSELHAAERLKVQNQERLVTVLSHQEKGDTLFLPEIDYQGVLYFEDLSEDPEHWINRDFTKAYGLEFKVATKNDLPKR